MPLVVPLTVRLEETLKVPILAHPPPYTTAPTPPNSEGALQGGTVRGRWRGTVWSPRTSIVKVAGLQSEFCAKDLFLSYHSSYEKCSEMFPKLSWVFCGSEKPAKFPYVLSRPNRAMPPRCAMRFESHAPKSIAMRKGFFFSLAVWSAANGGLRDGGLSKTEDIWGKRPFPSVFWISQALFAPSGKGRKRQRKGEKGRFRPISRKGGQTPLKPPFVTPPFAAAQAVRKPLSLLWVHRKGLTKAQISHQISLQKITKNSPMSFPKHLLRQKMRNILARLFLTQEIIRAACLQNEIAPEKLFNRYEKRFEKREKRSEKRSETRLKKKISPSQAA